MNLTEYHDKALEVMSEILTELDCPDTVVISVSNRNIWGATYNPHVNEIALHKGTPVKDFKLVLRHELAHYLLNHAGFVAHGHAAHFLATHIAVCGSVKEYKESGAEALDKLQVSRWQGKKSVDVYKQCRGNDGIKSIVSRISDSSTLIDRLTARIFTDNRNGQKAFNWLIAGGGLIGLMVWQAITSGAFSVMALLGIGGMIFLKMTK